MTISAASSGLAIGTGKVVAVEEIDQNVLRREFAHDRSASGSR
jgi:hypothetical protein